MKAGRASAVQVHLESGDDNGGDRGEQGTKKHADETNERSGVLRDECVPVHRPSSFGPPAPTQYRAALRGIRSTRLTAAGFTAL